MPTDHRPARYPLLHQSGKIRQISYFGGMNLLRSDLEQHQPLGSFLELLRVSMQHTRSLSSSELAPALADEAGFVQDDQIPRIRLFEQPAARLLSARGD